MSRVFSLFNQKLVSYLWIKWSTIMGFHLIHVIWSMAGWPSNIIRYKMSSLVSYCKNISLTFKMGRFKKISGIFKKKASLYFKIDLLINTHLHSKNITQVLFYNPEYKSNLLSILISLSKRSFIIIFNKNIYTFIIDS